MIIHVFSIMRDEEAILPYFLRHYSAFADKIFVLDDHSIDRTVEIAKAHDKVELVDFNYEGGLNEDEHTLAFVEAYKKYSRGIADWVICVDADEFIYHKDIKSVFEAQRERGRQVLKARGYNMFSASYPKTDKQLYEVCNMGLRNTLYDKQVIFDPSLDISFTSGRHKAILPEGINFYSCKLVLLHYRYLDKESTLNRLKWPRHNASERKMAWKRQRDLARYEQGLRGELGELEKVV